MSNSLLITGSLAFDHIMRFNGKFEENILPENLSNLSVSFMADKHERFFGGCAGNIGYNLALLGENVYISGRHGGDFSVYRAKLDQLGIGCLNFEYQNCFTASAYILSDNVDSQIAFFSPSAMSKGDVDKEIESIDFSLFDLVMISPDNPERMKAFCRHCKKNSIPYVFDPGQGLSILSGEELMEFANSAEILIFNEYESELFCKKSGISFESLKNRVCMVVKTLGHRGAEVYMDDKLYSLPAIKIENPVDITGAGDAFRAGFIYGIRNKLGIYRALAYGNTAASFAIEQIGTQEHFFDNEVFIKRLNESYTDLDKYID